MTGKGNRGDFSPAIKDALAKRASFICSNPDCHALTLAPSPNNPDKAIYIGVAAHITAAAPGGARYNQILTEDEREAIDNGLFLCGSCSLMIDKNKGLDFPVALLNQWKQQHEEWIRLHLNKRIDRSLVNTTATSPTFIQHGSLIVIDRQLGGQVAHSITNIGSQPRQLSKGAIDELITTLRRYPPVAIDFLSANDSETQSVKVTIKEALVAAGWTTHGDIINLIATMQPGINVKVLTIDREHPGLTNLLLWMMAVGLKCSGSAYDAGLSRPRIDIGPNAL